MQPDGEASAADGQAKRRPRKTPARRPTKTYTTVAALLYDHPIPSPFEDPRITEYRQMLGLLPRDLNELEAP